LKIIIILHKVENFILFPFQLVGTVVKKCCAHLLFCGVGDDDDI